MAVHARSGARRRSALAIVLIVVMAAAGMPPAVAQSDEADDGDGPLASFLADLLGPDESFAPVEIELTGSLPRSATFQGVELVVDRVHLTNTHPYWMFGEPEPGELYYVVVGLTARNPTERVHDYGFGDETFEFRTWSGRLLAHVPAPGRYAFSRLEPGDEREDEIVFGSETPDVLDGSALLVGRPPDTQLVIPLTAPPLAPDYPTPVSPSVTGPYQAGVIAWSVLGGEAGLDRPADVCCPDTGSRADDGELFLTLQLTGRVDGSQYGQATVSSDAVRLVVDGQPVAPLEFAGKANVAEGEAYGFASTWVTHENDAGLAIQFLDGTDVVETVPLVVGATAATTDAAPESSGPPDAAPSDRPLVASPGAAAEPTPAATPSGAASAPTPRPATAAIATLLIYSGRPDPDWSLTAKDLEQLESIAASLTPVDGVPPEGGLGYRGFRVTGPQGTWRANEGVVMSPDSAPGTSLADPERLVERFLFERGLAELNPDEVDIVTAALALDRGPATE